MLPGAHGTNHQTTLTAEEREMVDILEGAEPFAFEGNDIGVLVVHGFTGCPQSMRY